MSLAFAVPSLGAAALFILAVVVAAVLVNILKTNLKLDDWAVKLITLVVVLVAIAYALHLFQIGGV